MSLTGHLMLHGWFPVIRLHQGISELFWSPRAQTNLPLCKKLLKKKPKNSRSCLSFMVFPWNFLEVYPNFTHTELLDGVRRLFSPDPRLFNYGAPSEPFPSEPSRSHGHQSHMAILRGKLRKAKSLLPLLAETSKDAPKWGRTFLTSRF